MPCPKPYAEPCSLAGACGQDAFVISSLPQVGPPRPPSQRRSTLMDHRAKLSREESDDSLGIKSDGESEDEDVDVGSE